MLPISPARNWSVGWQDVEHGPHVILTPHAWQILIDRAITEYCERLERAAGDGKVIEHHAMPFGRTLAHRL